MTDPVVRVSGAAGGIGDSVQEARCECTTPGRPDECRNRNGRPEGAKHDPAGRSLERSDEPAKRCEQAMGRHQDGAGHGGGRGGIEQRVAARTTTNRLDQSLVLTIRG